MNQATETTQKAPEERASEFVAVEGGGEQTSAMGTLAAAYIVMWSLLMGFLFLTWRRQQRLSTRIGDLEQALRRADERGSSQSA